METIKKFKQKRKKRKKAKSPQKKRGKVQSKRMGGMISRKEGRLERWKNYAILLYFSLGIVFMILMILFAVLGVNMNFF